MTREPILMAVCGKKGVGKSFKTMEYLRNYVNKSPRRKVLIFDVNNEYSDKSKFPDIRAIALKDIERYNMSKIPEIRRVAPFFDDGRKMTLDDMASVLLWLVRNFYNGLLLIEDINKYVGDNMPGDLIGAICTNRHQGVDIILHYQSIGRITPKVWQNINCLRMHRNTDSVDRHKMKFPDKHQYLKIAEIIIKRQYYNGNQRYYLFVDFDNEKVYTGLGEEEIKEAITEYISEEYATVIAPYANKRDGGGNLVNTKEQAFVNAKAEIYDLYFSNTSTTAA
jgi:hypothetical protein